MKSLTCNALLATCLLSASYAYAGSTTPTDDTYVQGDNSSGHGSAAELEVKSRNGAYYARHAFIRFAGVPSDNLIDVSLSLDVSSLSNSGGSLDGDFEVWGIKEGALGSCKEDFSESTLRFNTVPFFDSTTGYVDTTNSSCLHDSNSYSIYAQPVANFSISAADLNQTVTVSNYALADFLRASDEGVVTFVISRSGMTSASLVSKFASKEHPTLNPPTLSWHQAYGSSTAAADSYVRDNNDSPHGVETSLVIKRGSSSYNRKGMLRFNDVPNSDVKKAELALDVASMNGGSAASFYVWGIKDGAAASCKEGFDEASLVYADLPFLNTSSDGVDTNSSCLHDTDPATAGNQALLGTLNISSADVGETVTLSNQALADFLNANSDGVVSFVLTRVESTGSLNTSFASKEHATLNPPTLSWRLMQSALPSDDTFVRRGEAYTNYSSSQHVVVKNYGTNSTTYKGMLTFDQLVPEGIIDASLAMDVSTISNTSTIYLFGIQEGAGCSEGAMENWAIYASYPFFDDSPDGVDNGSPCLYNGNLLTTGASPLVTLVLTPADVNKTVTFKSDALTRFLNENQNKIAAFVLTRKENNSASTAFASKEHATLNPPKLSWSYADGIEFDGGELVDEGNNTISYTGNLRLPIVGGQYITFAEADIVAEYDSIGRLKTFSGTVGFPLLPSVGLWGPLGDIESDNAYFQIGYDYGSAFNSFGLPLNNSKKYFYLSASTVMGISWGPMSLEAPGQAELLLAIDTTTPGIFFHGMQDGTFLPLGTEANFGFSGSDSIPFAPNITWGNSQNMHSFEGNVYVGGVVDLPLDLDDAISAEAYGEVAVNINEDDLGIDDLGFNAGIEASFEIGLFELGINLADATAAYHRGEGFAFSGVYEPGFDDFMGLPISLKKLGNGNSAKVAVFIDENGNGSYLDLEAEFKFGAAFAAQKIEGFIHADNNGVSLYGEAKFGPRSIEVTGEIYGSYAAFSGSIENNWNIGVGSIETDIDVSFDSRNTEVELELSAKFCADGLGCDSVGGEASVNEDGKIRVCVNIPGVGEKCDTLN